MMLNYLLDGLDLVAQDALSAPPSPAIEPTATGITKNDFPADDPRDTPDTDEDEKAPTRPSPPP